MHRFRFVDWKDPLVVVLPIGLGAMAVVGLRTRVFEAPWVREYLPRGWILLLGLAVVSGMAFLGIIVVLNGALDPGMAVESRRVVVAMDAGETKNRAPSVTLGCDGCKPIEWVGQAPANAGIGSTAIVRIGPGLFGRPWVERIEFIGPDRPRRTPVGPAESGMKQAWDLARFLAVVGSIVWYFQRRADSRRM